MKNRLETTATTATTTATATATAATAITTTKCLPKAHVQSMRLKHVHFLVSRLQEHRHVEADQVPIQKRPVVGNGVAGNLVHAGAHGLFPERRRWTMGTRKKVRKKHAHHTQCTVTGDHS